MPYGNRMGPWGAGPMTGRGAGYCAGFDAPGYMNPSPGFGGGRGWGGGGYGGGGRGWRHRFWATGFPGWARGGWVAGPPVEPYPSYFPEVTREQEINMLRAQAKQFEKSLEELRKHIADLEASGNEDS